MKRNEVYEDLKRGYDVYLQNAKKVKEQGLLYVMEDYKRDAKGFAHSLFWLHLITFEELDKMYDEVEEVM